MFAQQSRAQFAPMNMPPGSPRQAGGGMGKGGGGQVSTPGGGGKGGGGQPMRGRAFDNNPGGFGGPRGFGGPALVGGPMLAGGPAPTGGGDPIPGLQTMTGGPRPAGPPVLNEYGLPAVQPQMPALNAPAPSFTPGFAPQPVSQNMIQQAVSAGPRPMAPTPSQSPALNQYGLPQGMHPSQMPGLMAQLQGFGGF